MTPGAGVETGFSTPQPRWLEDFFAKEEALVRKAAYGSVLDVGSGDGRIMPHLLDTEREVTAYTAVEPEKELLRQSRRYAPRLRDAGICTRFVQGVAEELPGHVDEASQDTTLCLWSTIGILDHPELALEQMGRATNDKVFLSLVAKGSLDLRRELYDGYGAPYEVDEETETITSPVWGCSRAYELDDLEAFEAPLGARLAEAGRVTRYGIFGLYRRNK